MPGPPAGSTLGVVTSLGPMQGDVAAALEAVSIPSYAIDSDGVVRWVNPAAEALVGDARGRQFTSFVAPPDRRRARELFAQKIAGTAKVTDAEAVLLDKHGNAVVVELSSVPLVQGGRIVGVFGQAHVEGAAAEVPHLPPLTPRQTEVLRLLERGRSTGQIADQLNLSRETVRNHIRHILGALGVHTRLEAVVAARAAHGLHAGPADGAHAPFPDSTTGAARVRPAPAGRRPGARSTRAARRRNGRA
jgi:PAS domain S-box-containing protein